MKRTFNYTGRKRLDGSAFVIRLFEKENAPSEFDVELHRSCMPSLPERGVAWVEAYRGARTMRFRLGIRAFAEKSARLTLSDFDPNEPVLFRLKIVDENDSRRPVLGWRDRIRPFTYSKNGLKKKSVLPVLPCDLGHVAWDIDWQDPLLPVLRVNSRINDAKSVTAIVKSDPDFAALVFPTVIREVLTRLLMGGADEEEDGDENEWLIFGTNLVGKGCELDDDDRDGDGNEEAIRRWVNAAVQAFGRQAALIPRYMDLKSRST